MNTPICDFVRAYVRSGTSRLHMPGHKGRAFLGCEPLDLTEIAGADELYAPDSIIAESEANASSLFGTAHTFYSTEGSSQCIRAMLFLAMQNASGSGRPRILAARNVHRSFLTAAALLDLNVSWLWPETERRSLCSCPISPACLDAALRGLDEPPAAVYVTSPDYLGNRLDLAGLSSVCHGSQPARKTPDCLMVIAVYAQHILPHPLCQRAALHKLNRVTRPVIGELHHMSLNYAVRQSDDANGQKIAYPQYTPVQSGNQAVDALTGKLVDITPSFFPYPVRYGANDSKDAATTAAGGLTETELKTASELKDTLSKSVLESTARAISELGLTSAYTLNSVNYYAQQDGDDTSRVIASLSFSVDSSSSQTSVIQTTSGTAKIVQPGSYKSVTLDAKLGTLISVSSYRGYDSDKPTVNYTRNQAQTIAQAFAGKMESTKLTSTVLADSDNATPDSELTEQQFVFQRTANGIPFPQNAITVSVDTMTGTIASYQVSWEDDMQFSSADHLISSDKAADLYTKAVGAVLSYVTVSGAKDNALTLAYVFTPDSAVWGVDAASGDLLKDNSSDSETLSYSDIAGSYAKAAIEKLAGYGIGFSDGKFQPDKSLTQEDLLTLLVAAGGGPVIYPMAASGDDSQDQDTLYQQAYSMMRSGVFPSTTMKRSMNCSCWRHFRRGYPG